jgi:hypothetical protein
VDRQLADVCCLPSAELVEELNVKVLMPMMQPKLYCTTL